MPWVHLQDGVRISIHAPPRGATGRGVRDGRGVCISIHAPPRGATTAWRLTWSSGSDFNSRPSARGDGTRYAVHGANERFQFTPLREGRPHGVAAMQRRGIFQFTPLREGRHRLDYSGGQCRRYFNSRPSARGDHRGLCCPAARPYFNSRPSARGDGAVCDAASDPLLFQFTPLREGRLFLQITHPSVLLFQFTPLREGRRLCRREKSAFYSISIHAPPRGATRTGRPLYALSHHFNSLPSARGDLASALSQTSYQNFNSRPSARGDGWIIQAGNAEDISIHAPPRGATVPRHSCDRQERISIHAPPRGATVYSLPVRCTIPISIHAPPRGATGVVVQLVRAVNISIHAPPRGATTIRCFPWQCPDFNSRPSARGDGRIRSAAGM